jgi:hypothetical protein
MEFAMDHEAERDALEQWEFIFTHSAVIAGNSLRAIKLGELYKPHFDTFDEYATQEWGLNEQAVEGLLSAAILFEIKLDGGPTYLGPEAVGEEPRV